MKARTLATDALTTTARFDRTVSYMIPYDLGVTFGSIYDAFRKWVKRDLKNAVKFNTEYVKTRLASDKEFVWNKGLLGQARKPCLSVQCGIDHSYDSEVYRHPSMKNWDAVHFLEPDEFTNAIIQIEDNLDLKNNLEIAISMKSIQLDLQAGIAVGSRNQADNIANVWTTRRSTNYYYPFDTFIDFKIPDELIELIREQFNMKDASHHQLLKWLNRNSRTHIYYTMDGYNGKYYYFFRYVSNSLIKVIDMTNPQEFETRGVLKGESYAFTRSFELEILVPSIIAIKKYGDRIILDKYKNNLTKSGVTPEDLTKGQIGLSERYIEIEKVFDNKHALIEIPFKWTEDDLITHKSGQVTTKKFSLFNFIDKNHPDGRYIYELIAWAKTKGYKNEDLFNFQLFKATPINSNKNPLVEPIENGINIPPDSNEKKYYIKNMREFSIVDLKPDVNEALLGIIYIDLLIKNQYEYEIGRLKEQAIGNDDLGITMPYGPSKSTVDTNYK